MSNTQKYIQNHQQFQAIAAQTLEQIAQLEEMKPIVNVVKQVMDMDQLFDVALYGNKLDLQFKTNYMPKNDPEYMDDYIKYVLIIDILNDDYNVEIYSTPSDDHDKQFHMEHYYVKRYHHKNRATSPAFMNNLIRLHDKITKLINDYRVTTYFNRDVYDVLEPTIHDNNVRKDTFDNAQLTEYLTELGGQIYIDKWNDLLSKYYLISRTKSNQNYVYHEYILDDHTYTGPLSNQVVYDAVCHF